MALTPMNNNRLVRQGIACCMLHNQDVDQDRINELLGAVIKIGWRNLYDKYFNLEHLSNANANLICSILYCDFSHVCTSNEETYRAWLDMLYQSNLSQLLDFFRKSNGDINFADESGQTIFHVFLRIYIDDLPRDTAFKVVEKLIEMGASVNAVDADHYTPLHIVAEKGEIDLIQLILRTFTNVNAACGYSGDTVLHDIIYACNDDKPIYRDQYARIVISLLTKGANPNKVNIFEITPLHCAVEYNFYDILLIFQIYNADLRQLTVYGESLLHTACAKNKNVSVQLQIIDLLVGAGCNVNIKDEDGMTALHLAAKLRSAKIIERLIQLGANVNVTAKELRVTPLHLAVSHNLPNNVKILLKAGANPNAKTKHGVTPLHIAASRESIKTMKYLIKFGADVHIREKHFDFTPLHIAISACKKKAELLLKKGADVNVTNKDGVTPLHLAAVAGNGKVVELLLKRDANIYCRGTKFNFTPLHLISTYHNPVGLRELFFKLQDLRRKCFFNMFKWVSTPIIYEDNVIIAQMLIKHGTDVNVKDGNGRTPLHLATLQTENAIVETLLNLGAYVDEYDDEGRTPWRNALANKTTSTLLCLLKYGLDVNDNDVVKEYRILEDKNLICFLLHIMERRTLDLPVHDGYQCREQLYFETKELKKLKINDSHISVYQFLHMKPRAQVKLVEHVLNMTLNIRFPEFFNVIHATCRQAMNRMTLIEPAISALNQVTGTLWPEICAEYILSFCNNRHLRMLIDSADLDDI